MPPSCSPILPYGRASPPTHTSELQLPSPPSSRAVSSCAARRKPVLLRACLPSMTCEGWARGMLGSVLLSWLESCQPRAIAPPCPFSDPHIRYLMRGWPGHQSTIPPSSGPACQPTQQPQAHPSLLPSVQNGVRGLDSRTIHLSQDQGAGGLLLLFPGNWHRCKELSGPGPLG